MLTRKYYTIFAALFFLSLGVFSSPTIVSLYHILIAIPALMILFTDKRETLSKSSWILLMLFAWGTLCTVYNFDELNKPSKSLQEMKYYLFGVLCIFPLRYFFEQAAAKHIKFLISTLSFVLIVGFFVGVIKAFGGFDIVKWKAGDYLDRSGGFLNYMRYGYGSAFLFLLGLSMFYSRQKLAKFINPKFFYPALVLCFLAVFTAKTRGALLALMVGLPFFYLKYQPKMAKAVIAMGSVFVLVILYFSFVAESAPSRFLNIKDGSNKKRMSQFYTAVKAIEERPMLGWGADQFSYHVSDLKQKYDIWSKNYVGHSHNIFLEHGVSFGFVGAILLMLFLVFWFFEMLALKSDFGWGIATYIVAFTVGGQVELLFDNLNSHVLFFVYALSQVGRDGALKLSNK